MMRTTPRDARRPAGMWLALAAGLALLTIAPVAVAQPAVDRAAIEEKRKRDEEQRQAIEAAKKKKLEESGEQAELRKRDEEKAARRGEALQRAQMAQSAASRRQNRKAMEFMNAAWMLDPQNMNYPFFTAALAEANNESELEFTAYAAFERVANHMLEQFGDADHPMKATLIERKLKASERVRLLREKFSSGVVRLSSVPDSCDILLDGAWVGQGSGQLEALVGSHKAEAYCVGFYPFEQPIIVRAGDPANIVLRPNPVPFYGNVVVELQPSDGVTIFFDDVSVEQRLADKPTKDGKIAGKGTRKNPYRLLARKWIIRFHKDGYDRWHRRLTVTRDGTVMVQAKLEKMSEAIERE